MHRTVKTVISLVFITLFFTTVKAQQETTPAFISDSLDRYIDQALKDWQIPGIAVAIVKDGKVVLQKGYGVKEINGDKVDDNTLFMIGSNSKAFTATALAMLHHDKKLSLDDLVTKWIPSFKLDNKAAGEQAIIRDLLCHRLGFQTFQGDFTYWESNLTRAEVIEKMSHIKAKYPFRTKWGYTNAAFLTAGEIIPKATGIPWETFVTDSIFHPLGMMNTVALSKDLPSAANKATAYTIVDGKLTKIPFALIDNLAPAGSISSSANDLTKWVMAHLDGGRLNGQQVIPSWAIAETHKPHSILGDASPQFNEGHFSLYGLGFFLEEYQGRKIVSHTGGVNGFVSSITMIPEEKLGIIILTNTDDNVLFEALKWDIMDAYLKLPFRNYSKVYLQYYHQQKTGEQQQTKMWLDSAATHPALQLPLLSYTGNYSNDVYGNMSITVENGVLKMHFSHHPNMFVDLLPISANRVFARFSDAAFGKSAFTFNTENGKVKSVNVKVADFVEYDPYVFIKAN